MKRTIMMSIMFVLVITGLLLGSPVQPPVEKTTTPAVQCCCPVCKTPLTKENTQFKSDYKGKTIYFASAKCKAEFDKNPEKYAKACEPTVSYVCPMKQCNVKTDKPGKCPKCGMDLKKVEETAVSYACPMKQCNVNSDKPGKCPKCGMDLKPVQAAKPCCEQKAKEDSPKK